MKRTDELRLANWLMDVANDKRGDIEIVFPAGQSSEELNLDFDEVLKLIYAEGVSVNEHSLDGDNELCTYAGIIAAAILAGDLP